MSQKNVLPHESVKGVWGWMILLLWLGTVNALWFGAALIVYGRISSGLLLCGAGLAGLAILLVWKRSRQQKS